MIEANIIFRALMIVILGLFSVVFASVYLHDRKQYMAGWLAIAYISGLGAFLTDISRAALDPVLSDLLAKLLFWGFSAAFVLSVFAHHKSRYPVSKIGAIVGIGVIPQIWFGFVEPDIIMRSIFSSLTAGTLLLVALPVLWKKRVNGLDGMMFVLITLLCVIYFLRPYIIYGVLDAAHTAATYQDSPYAMLLHASSAFCGLACGVVMLVVIGNNIIIKYQLATTIDPLTGLLNRRGLDEYVHKELDKDSAANRAVMIIDLDEFKQVNDIFGHETGDHVLKRAAANLQRVAGRLGKVARIGGEEFVVILDQLSSADRLTIAQYLRLSVGMIVHPEIGDRDRVTASFGIALVDEDESFAMALRRADSALYEAKSDGRNCVVEASSDNSFMKIKYIERF